MIGPRQGKTQQNKQHQILRLKNNFYFDAMPARPIGSGSHLADTLEFPCPHGLAGHRLNSIPPGLGWAGMVCLWLYWFEVVQCLQSHPHISVELCPCRGLCGSLALTLLLS